jgi:hypothetical protein
MLAAAAAQAPVRVMLDALRGRLRHLQLLERPGRSQVQHGLQANAAPARPLMRLDSRVELP